MTMDHTRYDHSRGGNGSASSLPPYININRGWPANGSAAVMGASLVPSRRHASPLAYLTINRSRTRLCMVVRMITARS